MPSNHRDSQPAASDIEHRFSPGALGLLAVSLVAVFLPFSRALADLYATWSFRPEYSHGLLVPVVSLFLVWRERRWLSRASFSGSWWGAVATLLGLAMWLVGELSATAVMTQYAFLVVLLGLVLALAGWRVLKRLSMALLILVFMIPLPAFLSNSLSLNLQLLSSKLGVGIIRLAGISVFSEGNVIDLGTYKLQVAEACDGLRYLFPLMTLGFIIAYFFHGPLWKRVLLFLTSMPIAILMNVIRIGIIGITVDRWGTVMAEGFLHEFQGWVVFMLSTFLLLLVAMVLARVGPSKSSWSDTFQMDQGEPLTAGSSRVTRSLHPAFLAAATLAVLAAGVTLFLPDRVEHIPARAQLVRFPQVIDGWHGSQAPLEQVYLDALKLDDYIMADYHTGEASLPVNLYVAWYDSQRKGASAHSPRSCLPGGGWEIVSLQQRELSGVKFHGAPLRVNRVLIELGSRHQIVYYWFQQRGRIITNEYLVKWYIFLDSLTRNRTDGALVRLTIPYGASVTEQEAEAQLQTFAATAVPALSAYVPD